MSQQPFVASSQIWQLAPRLALVLTLPDPPRFEPADAQVAAGK